ncbi:MULTISPECIES: Na+/H+ antiporter subunit G [Alteromonadaceae]|jgi:multicomponent K+:H+ antiporter subunit G|uniref:Na+/H+ antiporter subunit G n=1 Tax=Brumicola blandensis TaxID=3075611 RepID=A0AAW8R7D2_9ALTE|nr:MULTISPECIES: Na+/H+ antiporter subunit G [unclassified Alteromonas]MDT0583740.1 Na+/H+ antiporter subunit G [Alteromonas sp. W409]MDT0629135.1 Na+/H+ antiporter subunit G [Alteromonas sp. W364]
MSFIAELTISILLVLGGLFVLIGSIGLLRLQDLYVRLHAPTKATTLGLGGILIGSMVYMYTQNGYISVNELLITLFLVITAPVTAHILAKAAMHHRVKMMERTRNQHLVERARMQLPPAEESETTNDDIK